jgi:predicted kinase
MAISKTVWRKGWQREAAETQAAAADLAALIHHLETGGLTSAAVIFRSVAMKHGARNGKAIILAALQGRARRQVSA